MITVKEIKARFPSPTGPLTRERRFAGVDDDGFYDGFYDVGGALVMFHNGTDPSTTPYDNRFPNVETLSEYLEDANRAFIDWRRNTGEDLAFKLAGQIIDMTDQGEIKGAWSFLEWGLTWAGKIGPMTRSLGLL